MSFKALALGITLGLGLGASIGLICAPEAGEDVRKELKKRIGDCLFRVRWQIMSPEERYVYFWARSRRQRHKAWGTSAHG